MPQRLAEAVRRAAEKRPFVFFFLLAAALNLLIESMARLSPLGGIAYLIERPVPFFFNTLLLFGIFSVSLLFRRRLFVLSVTAAVWLVLGITNAVVIALRASPLSGIDFAILRSCLPIVKIYLRFWHVLLIAAFLGGLVWLAARIYRKSRQYRVRFGREVLLFFAAAVMTGSGLLLSVRTGAVETSFTDLPGAYRDYGFVTCFSLSVLERGIEEPQDYSETTLRAIADTLNAHDGDDAPSGDPRPNIVAVQLESFMDPCRIAGAEFGEDPVPFFRELKEEYPSGFLRVNTVGAGTANTEFEVLTGIDLTFFGAGEYPYQTVLEEDDAVCESMASDLKASGYAAHAVHNHSASFYERYKAYGALGFDGFVPLEYMNGAEDNLLGWAKDAVLTGEISACMDATDGPDFVFAVSVQGHGLYPDERTEGDAPFDVKAPIGIEWTEDEEAQLAYYAGQVREMDDFLRDLVSELERRARESGEETLLLLYGDHLPPLPFDEGSFSDGSGPLDSEYVLVPIGEGISRRLADEEDRDLEAWEAGMRTMELAGAREGLICLCHRYFGEDEGFPDALRLLAYDMLYGERYAWGGETPFERAPLRMGIRPVTVVGVHPAEHSGRLTTVRGENFTPASVVTVNGWPVKTAFVSPEQLTAESEVSSGDRIAVIQRTEDFIVLGESAPYVVPLSFEEE